MLTVNKINTYTSFGTCQNNKKANSFGNNEKARNAYLEMNRDVYVDYVDGDISLPRLIKNKFQKLWAILTAQDPTLEIKAKMIEDSLLEQAKQELDYAA